MSSAPRRCLDELARTQDSLGRSLAEVRSRLVAARMQRISPTPLGDTGGRQGRRARRVEQVQVPEVVDPPGDLAAATRQLFAEESPPPVPPIVEPRSLVHEEVVLGNRRRIELVASVQVGEAGELEVSLHRVGGVEGDPDAGIELGPIIPGLVSEGWPYRALPWTEEVRRVLLAEYDLPDEVSRIPANGRPAEGGRLRPGDVFVIVARDPGVAERVEVPVLESVRFSREVLECKFKHAPDFWVDERFSEEALERFQDAIVEHIEGCDETYLVRHQGGRLLAHVRRGRIVWTTVEGVFVNGYNASSDQLRHVWAQSPWRNG